MSKNSSSTVTVSFNNPSNFYREWYYNPNFPGDEYHYVGSRLILLKNQTVVQTGGYRFQCRSGYMSDGYNTYLDVHIGKIFKKSAFPSQNHYWTTSYIQPNSSCEYIVSSQDAYGTSMLHSSYYSYAYADHSTPFNTGKPVQRSYHSVCPALEDETGYSFYIFGGKVNKRNDSIYLNDLWKVELRPTLTLINFESIKYTKIEAPNAPLRRYGHTMVYLQKKLIIFGGYDSDGFYSNEMFAFDLDTKKWQTISYSNPCPVQKTGLMHHTCVEWNNKLWIYGGKGKNNQGEDVINDSLLIFDWETKKWSQVIHHTSQIQQSFSMQIPTLQAYNSCGKRFGHLSFVENEELHIYFGADGYEEYVSGYKFLLKPILSLLQQIESETIANGYIIEDTIIESITLNNVIRDKLFRFGYTYSSAVLSENRLFVSPSICFDDLQKNRYMSLPAELALFGVLIEEGLVDDVLLHMLQFLPMRDLNNLLLLSKHSRIAVFAKSDILWKPFYLQLKTSEIFKKCGPFDKNFRDNLGAWVEKCKNEVFPIVALNSATDNLLTLSKVMNAFRQNKKQFGDTHLKLVHVGDGAVGKTCLLIRHATNAFPEEYVPTVFDNYSYDTVLRNERKIQVGLWDIGGGEDYDRLRPLSYPQTSLFVVCFSLCNLTSFDNVQSKWIPEVKHHCPKTPCVLVGLKKDLKSSVGMMRQLAMKQSSFVTPEMGKNMAAKLGCVAYFEVSARNDSLSVKELYDFIHHYLCTNPKNLKTK